MIGLAATVGGRGQRLWGYENDCNRHFSTVACCLNGPWAGKKGKSGSLIPAFLSERETFKAACVTELEYSRKLTGGF